MTRPRTAPARTSATPPRADSGVEIRPAALEELGAIGDLLDRAYSASYDIDQGYRDHLHRLEEFVPAWDVWVALDEGSLVGALITPAADQAPSYVIDPPTPELGFRLLGVDPTARGRGVGTALVNHVIDLARARGLARVGLYTGETMADAHRLYEALGFAREPHRDTHILEGKAKLVAYARAVDPPA